MGVSEQDKLCAEKITNYPFPNDRESRHIEADELLCELLKEHGYLKTVAAFEEIEKWYA